MLRDDPNPPRGAVPTRCAFRTAAVRSGGPAHRTAMGIRGPPSRHEKGRVVETTARNVFLVSGGSLQTPPTYDGALPGITRSAVLETAARAKIRAREIFVSLDRLRGADEVFLSGSGVGVLGIASVDGRRMEAPGRVTRTIHDGYAALLESEAKW